MWAEVICCTYYYLHNSRVRTDVITIVRRMAKHTSVLRQNTSKTLLKKGFACQNRKCFGKTESDFNLLGLFVENTFGRTLELCKRSFSVNSCLFLAFDSKNSS